ncbi:hypothetical protein AC1031_018488 [Aphanomyces cochlioides]|nr:hypothetical protein AC1031_018488 [Aphanomyces cochlioides]
MERSKQVALAVFVFFFLGACASLMYVAVIVSGTLSLSKWTDLLNIVVAIPSNYFLLFTIMTAALAFIASCIKNFLTRLNKWVLVCVCMFMVFAGVIASMGFRSALVASAWNKTVFPFDSDEAGIANGFNEAYCPVKFCSSSPTKSMGFFYPNTTNSSTVGAPSYDAPTMESLCTSLVSSTANISSELKVACAACPRARVTLHNNMAIFGWIAKTCHPTDTLGYCTKQLAGSLSNRGLSPYEKCRKKINMQWSHYAYQVAFGSTFIAVASLVYIIMASTKTKAPLPPQKSAYEFYHGAV